MNFTQKKLNRSVVSAGVVIALGLASYQANAEVHTFQVGFTTQAEASISSRNPLNFGSGMLASAFSSCVVDVMDKDNNGTRDDPLEASTTAFTEVIAGVTGASPLPALNGGGDCLDNDDVSIGQFLIDGGDGANIKIKVSTATGTEFEFIPIAVFDNNLTAATGTTELTADALTGVTLSGTGQAALFVGGTVNVLTDLEPNKPYEMDYEIEVTY